MTTAAKKAADTKTTATKKVTPPAQTGRADVLKQLTTLGWNGPTSYTVTLLRDELLPWVAAGKPADAPMVPAGAMNHAHPKPKVAKSKRLSAGYLAALADVLNTLDNGGDIREFVVEGLATGEAKA